MSKYFLFINIHSYYIYFLRDTSCVYLIYDTPYNLCIIFYFNLLMIIPTLQKNTTTEAIIYIRIYLTHATHYNFLANTKQ